MEHVLRNCIIITKAEMGNLLLKKQLCSELQIISARVSLYLCLSYFGKTCVGKLKSSFFVLFHFHSSLNSLCDPYHSLPREGSQGVICQLPGVLGQDEDTK